MMALFYWKRLDNEKQPVPYLTDWVLKSALTIVLDKSTLKL